MPKLKLKSVVDAIRPGDTERFAWDDQLTGYYLRVYPSGRKVYGVQYRNRWGRSRRYTIGTHGKLTPDAAWKLARGILARVDRGDDPAAERRETRSSPTVRGLAERWRQEHAPKLKPGTVKRAEGLLTRVIQPALGSLKVGAVTRADVARMHHGARDTPVEANRAVELTRKLFNLAERWGLREEGTNPARQVDRFKERRRERFLAPAEIGRLGDALRRAEEARGRIAGLDARLRTARGASERAELREQLLATQRAAEHPSAVLAIRLLMLTGCRRSEILRLKWSEVDLEGRRLVLGDSKTGAKTVPLAAPALRLLADAAHESGNPFVCWGEREGAPFLGIDKAWYRIRAAAKLEDVRLHDLRHSFASVGAAGGESLYVVGKVLGHTQAATTARYAHLADDPIRAAAERISGTIAAALEGRKGEVIELAGGPST